MAEKRYAVKATVQIALTVTTDDPLLQIAIEDGSAAALFEQDFPEFLSRELYDPTASALTVAASAAFEPAP